MTQDRLDKIFDVLVENEVFELTLPDVVKNNLKHSSRPYQTEALARLFYYLNYYKRRSYPTQLLFHMATGSGKTLVMAGSILELYQKGYRNFVFFVNTDTIIQKTKNNFLNPLSSKYLFSEAINIDGQNISIREVDSFESANDVDINILFSTIQGLHSRLNTPRENSITFDDFADKKVVFISDEAHHINSLTKRKLTGTELEIHRSWETTVSRIFNANPGNIMLEFTATLELKHPAIQAKYNSKLLYDYPLSRYREDGYSKEVQTNQIDFDPIDRALTGIIISQYKKKIFSKNGLLIKPVVMMKSKTTAESAEMEHMFKQSVQSLNDSHINRLRGLHNNTIQKAFKYFDEIGLTTNNLIDELRDDFSEDKVISINSKNDSAEKQIVINSLEDLNNEYRVVFAVDKLNEGWDVLNLFDIVRLYDTRDSRDGVPGATTIQEAQLIGRGARYCPFKLTPEQDFDKRKYDSDLDNEMRICETLHYHCSHNPKYIVELNNALREIGIIASDKIEVSLEVKESFKATNFYRNGFILVNRKVENKPSLNFEFEEPLIPKHFTYSLRTSYSTETLIFEDDKVKNIRQVNKATKEFYLNQWDKTIIKKALAKIPFYHFNRLKNYFPSIDSIETFITSNRYLGDVKVAVSGLSNDLDNLTPETILNICFKILSQIAEEINTGFGDYRGTKTFHRVPIHHVFRNKKLFYTLSPDAELGKATMRHDIEDKYYVNLAEREWFVYKENYGTSEEKFLVKFIDSQISELESRFSDIYLLRNERFFKLYRFSDGKATEPDFVLFMTDKENGEDIVYQIFIEPKGEQLLGTDRWKEDFLQEIEKEAIVEVFENDRFKLIGMPFYNESQTKAEFKSKLGSILMGSNTTSIV